MCCCMFFFKQKTAYEMRISDWSSDVCSSDLRGNSGGPLFDLQGNVVGINNMLISPVGANIGVNFAIPADAAIPVIEALRAGETPQRGYLGIGIVPVSEDMAAALGLSKDRGEIVQRIEDGQAAAKAGLKRGDD